MTPSTFMNHTRKAGIHRTGLGIGAVQDLELLTQSPQPLLPTKVDGEWGQKPSNMFYLGKLISHGFAVLDRPNNCYKITDAGREWLAAVKQQVISPTLQPA